MAYRLTVFTNTGKALAEIDASVHVAWAMNAPTRAEFSMSALDAKCTEKNLRFGNFVLFEHDTLPNWGGFIWPPRGWQQKIVTVGMMSGEAMLDRRIAPKSGTWEGVAPGIFKKALGAGNFKGDANIVQGNIRGHGSPITVELREQLLSDVVSEIQESSSHEWWFAPDRDDDGDLYFKANWTKRRGKHKEYVLIEGKNFIAGRASEEGNLYNYASITGEGLDDTAPRSHAHNQKSRARYGLTEYSETMSVTDEASLESRAKEVIQREAFPRMMFTGTVLEEAFGRFGVGDTVSVQFNAMRFFGRGTGMGGTIWARAMAMEYKTEENALAVTFEQADEPKERDNG